MENYLKTRENNIELLRIFAMLMIVTLHFLGHGGILERVPLYSTKYYICWIIEGMCYIAVNLYVLISGFFLVDSKFKLKKLIILLGQVFTFSIAIYFITGLLEGRAFSKLSLINAIFPTSSGEYWFATVYVGMYILSPFINVLLNNISQLTHLMLTCLLVILFSILPNLFFYTKGLNYGGGNGIVWFIVLYIVAAYVKKYKRSIKQVYTGGGYLMCSMLLPISLFALKYIAQNYNSEFLSQYTNLMYSYNSIFCFIASILAFSFFLNIKVRSKIYNKIIAIVSSTTFGVYLIHDNPYIRSLLWGNLKVYKYLEMPLLQFIINMVFIILMIFVCCSLITLIINKLLSYINSSEWLNTLSNKLEEKALKVLSFLIK